MSNTNNYPVHFIHREESNIYEVHSNDCPDNFGPCYAFTEAGVFLNCKYALDIDAFSVKSECSRLRTIHMRVECCFGKDEATETIRKRPYKGNNVHKEAAGIKRFFKNKPCRRHIVEGITFIEQPSLKILNE